jgi:hypothetical protein
VLTHPLAPLIMGIRAYGAWVRGEFDHAVTLAHESRRLEFALGIAPTGLPERVLLNVKGTIDRGAHPAIDAARQVDLAEASGNPSRLVHACYMGAVVLSSIGAHDDAVREVARAQAIAEQTQSPTDLASAAVARGFATRGADDVALEAFRAAEAFAVSAGNRWMTAFARTEISGLQVHLGALSEGCHGLAEVVDTWFRAGEWAQQWHTLSRCMIALHRLGHLELAAEVLGAIEAHALLGVAPMSPTLRAVAIATRDAVTGGLGADHADQLRARGASRPVVETVERTRRALVGRLVSG